MPMNATLSFPPGFFSCPSSEPLGSRSSDPAAVPEDLRKERREAVFMGGGFGKGNYLAASAGMSQSFFAFANCSGVSPNALSTPVAII